jgi:hypothetical protein
MEQCSYGQRHEIINLGLHSIQGASIVMKVRKVISVLLLLCAAISASATTITYEVMIDTSSIDGTTGSLDFNFNPGSLRTQTASLQILGFSSDGALVGSPALTGDVSGTLQTTVTFDNGTGFNDYFEEFTYGSFFSFDVSLSGAALTSPDGGSTSGSTFAFSTFSDAAGTIPALTTDLTDGLAFIVDVNLDGTTTVTDYSDQTTVETEASAAPEPCSLFLVATGLMMLGVLPLRRRLAASR